MNNIKITAKKELRSLFRDKKTLIMLFVLPLMILFIILLYGFMFDSTEESYEGETIIGINYEANDIEKQIFKDSNIKTKYYDNRKDMKKDMKNGEIGTYIYLEDNVYTIYMGDSLNGSVATEKATSYLEAYNKYLAEQYINENNLDSNKIYNNIVYKVDTEESNYILTLIYSIAFTYTIMSIVMASSNMAMNATATEKENGTLETILTLPIKTDELIIGKHVAGAIMSIVVSLFSLVMTIGGLYIGKAAFKSFSEFQLNISAINIIESLIVIVAASILISGLAISMTAFAKTSKEAQSKTQVLSFISMIPMFINMLDINLDKIIYFIPICNYAEALMKIFNGKIHFINIVVVFLSSIIYIAFIIKIIINQYKEEKVLFAK